MNISPSQIVSQLPFPKIQCPNHPKDFVTFINFENTCILDFHLNIQKLVRLQSFFNDQDDENNSQIIKNLTPSIPSFTENDLLENLEVQMKQTTEYFNEFKQRINNIIDESLKQALDDIKQLNLYRNNVMTTYNNLSKKTEIKSLIEKYSSTPLELVKQFKELIQEKNNSSYKDQKVLQELLTSFIVKKKKIDINYLKNKLNSCVQSLKGNIKGYNIKQTYIESFDKIINTQNLDQAVQLILRVYSDFNINNQQCKQLADKLGQCVNTESLNLNLYCDGITSEGYMYLAEGIRKCKQLQYLELNIKLHNIKDEGVIKLCKGISEHHQQLQKLDLDLSKNNIYDYGANAVADLIKQSKNIRELRLNFYWNYITDKGVLSIIEALKQFQQLYLSINFTENKIKNKEQHTINLKSINLKNNNSVYF